MLVPSPAEAWCHLPPASSHPTPPQQAALVLGQVQELVCRTLVQWITQGGSSSAADGGADGAPACPPGLMRFGAHLALALWALNIAEVAEG